MMTMTSRAALRPSLARAMVCGVLAIPAAVCGGSAAPPKVQSTYDPATGKLASLSADLNGDGRVDTWTYMDGAKPVRTEQDMDGDGKIERWEYTRPDGSAEKVAVSRAKNGVPDMWTYFGPTGEIVRVETAFVQSNGTTGAVQRTELYESDRLVRVEEDTDGDGRVDKWEFHDGPIVQAVEFDYDHDGKPDERITMAPDGRVTDRQKLTGQPSKTRSGGRGSLRGPLTRNG